MNYNSSGELKVLGNEMVKKPNGQYLQSICNEY